MQLHKSKIALIVFGLLLLTATALANEPFEFKGITFVAGTTLSDQLPKSITLPKAADHYILISQDGVELINRKDHSRSQLLAKTTAPVLVYQIEPRKKGGIVYAIFERKVSYAMETEQFVLIGRTSDSQPFTHLVTLPLLKTHGWKSVGLQLRINKQQLFIDGVTKTKASPDHLVQPFKLEWIPATGTINFTDIKAQRDREDLPKALRADDFSLAGLNLGDKLATATQLHGPEFKVEEYQDEQTQATISVNTYERRLAVHYDKQTLMIKAIYVFSKHNPTARKITVGMGIEEMLEQYGHNYQRKRDDKVIYYLYTMKRHHPDSNDLAKIGFAINDNNKIAWIYTER